MVKLGERRSANIPSRRDSSENKNSAGANRNERKEESNERANNSNRSRLALDIHSSEEDEEDDEIIQESINSIDSGSRNKKFIYILFAIIAVVVAFVIYFLFLHPGNSNQDIPNENNEQQEQTQQNIQQANNENLSGVGTQDFTQNTTMYSNSPMTNPDNFTKDIYGLTTRVDYTVSQIQYIADFVSYTKHRGTWGGGLELYYLDCTYKDSKYVVQVPFSYYKELDDSGIVPVKMEVLRIVDSSSSSGYLTIISYMCLDEETLKTILKSQNK